MGHSGLIASVAPVGSTYFVLLVARILIRHCSNYGQLFVDIDGIAICFDDFGGILLDLRLIRSYTLIVGQVVGSLVRSLFDRKQQIFRVAESDHR